MFNVGDCIETDSGNEYEVMVADHASGTYDLKNSRTGATVPGISYRDLMVSGARRVPRHVQIPPSKLSKFSVGQVVQNSNGNNYTIKSVSYTPPIGWEYVLIDGKGYDIPGIWETTILSWPLVTLSECAQPQIPACPARSECHIVKSSVLNKDFLYCRTHDEEADAPPRCRKTK